MTTATWFLVIGAVLLFMALTGARLKRLPLSTAIVYLAVGLALGPTFADQFHFNPLDQSALLEVFTEIAVLISLFGAGLKLAAPTGHRIWRAPLRLATLSMISTVGLIAVVAMWLLNLSLGAAILLGAILAPTDPVLASDVQVRHAGDDDHVRFSLTGEAGLNDGTAFPMVMLGLGLLGYHDLGDHFANWWMVDVLWACSSGLFIGSILGAATAHAMFYLQTRGLQSEMMENFLGLGLIALSYGLTLLLAGYGFLAVFAAAYFLHETEARLQVAYDATAENARDAEGQADDSAPYMARVSLRLVEQLERLMEVALLILVGGMMFADSWQLSYILCAVLVLFVVRPLSVFLGLIGSGDRVLNKAMLGWFGVKGIGSFYYLMYAVQHGIDEDLAVTLISVVLVTVAISILLHGASVKPLMKWYAGR